MDKLIYSLSQFTHAMLEFIDVGGIVMWPLFGCCLWMLWLASQILFRAPKLSHCSKAVPNYPTWLNQRLNEIEIRKAYQKQAFDLQGIKLLSMIAPLLGLLGTVSGMITMFTAGANYGYHDPAVISSGISMAMVTTQTGLLIGLSGGLLAYFWQKRLNKIQHIDHQGGCYAE